MKGKCFLIRFADDFIIGFQLKTDADRVMAALAKRFERFKLSLHPEKISLIYFGRPMKGVKQETFYFLGFTYYWARSLTGRWAIKKKTAGKRLRRFLSMLWAWCKGSRHDPLGEQHETLCSKLRGFYQYFGVRSNYEALEVAFKFAVKALAVLVKSPEQQRPGAVC